MYSLMPVGVPGVTTGLDWVSPKCWALCCCLLPLLLCIHHSLTFPIPGHSGALLCRNACQLFYLAHPSLAGMEIIQLKMVSV